MDDYKPYPFAHLIDRGKSEPENVATWLLYGAIAFFVLLLIMF